MELITLSILSSFKNLMGLKILFKENEPTYVIIGNNGSGKSSILEALSSIFGALYDNTKETVEFEFDFNLVYTINSHKVELTHKRGTVKVKINGATSTVIELQASYLPSRIICNYSGEDVRMKEKYYAPLFNDYISRLKNLSGQNVLRMIFVDRDMWQIILLIMLSCKDEWKRFAEFIDKTLKLPDIDTIHIEIDDTQLNTWSENAVTYYIRQILRQLDKNNNIHIDQINLTDADPFTLFNLWNSARPLIKEMSISFVGGVDSMMLSEGEKKLMVVLFILESIADESSLVLLDEPDSHIHVARKADLKRYFDNSANRKNILTSHSPTLTAKFPAKSIIMLDRNMEGLATVVERNKQDIVAQLTNDIWTLQEQNIFLASNKTVLVVEGKTDEIILSTALKHLQQGGQFKDMDFSYLPCGGASNVPVLASKFTPKTGQKMITFFDADTAGWEAIRKIFGDNNLGVGNFGKARKKDYIWYTAYPSCKKVSNFNLEDYFPRSVFLHYVMSFKGLKDLCTEKNIKQKMAEDCLKPNEISAKEFEKFALVFKRVQDIYNADKQKKVQI